MIKKSIKKIIVLGIISMSIIAFNPIVARADWKQDYNGWWYSEGNSYATGWREINGEWYYFYPDGPSDVKGYMAIDTWVGSYFVNIDGHGDYGTYNYLGSNKTYNPSPSKDFSFDSRTGTITRYKGSDKDVIIPGKIDGVKVTKIGSSAFMKDLDKDNLENVIIPEGVTSIEYAAFSWNQKLKSIVMPASVTSIGEDAFRHCSSLENVTISKGVISIGKEAFIECPKLKSVEIPGIVTSIGNDAFENCSNLENITISEGTTSIGKYAFYNCDGLKNIVIPGSVTSIGECAFESCDSLKNVVITKGVVNIGKGAFGHCISLETVKIPESVTHIGTYAFSRDYHYLEKNNLIKFYVANKKVKNLLIGCDVDTIQDAFSNLNITIE